MCGIAGFISLNNTIEPDQLKGATRLLRHRGPDAEGFYFTDDKKIGLGHRRLSILDLSVSANQPMFSSNGRYVIIFNGEVYNFKELRQNLKNKGAGLKTNSDTEVILELFAEKGTECFKELNGMFALAIFDICKNVLTLARDHAGIKPLSMYFDEGDFVFASELKAIHYIKKSALTINKKAIPYFLHLGFIPHPLTIYNNTEKFLAASFLQIDVTAISSQNLNAHPKSFWRPESIIGRNSIKDEKKAKATLNSLLLDSVEKQLISDVPIGTFLSGGVDSSIVTAIASKVSKQKINSYSIAIDDGRFNESKYAHQVSRHLKTQHHEFNVKEKEVVELINELIPVYHEPFADSSAFPTMMVSRLAKKNVTVALSGDGGDELFMGYGAYKWAKILDESWVPLAKLPLFSISKLLNDRYQRTGKLFAYNKRGNLKTHIFSQEQYFFREQELSNILIENKFDFIEENMNLNTNRKLTPVEEQSLWDFNYYLPDDLLVKTDRASMHYSLEIRVPLLDYRITEFAFNLDTNLKIRGNDMKYLLKQVLYDYLPEEIFRRPKWGFSIPLKKCLKTDLSYLIEKYTSKSIIEKYDFLNYEEVEKLKKLYNSGKDHLFNRLWVIIVLHWWLEENSIN